MEAASFFFSCIAGLVPASLGMVQTLAGSGNRSGKSCDSGICSQEKEKDIVDSSTGRYKMCWRGTPSYFDRHAQHFSLSNLTSFISVIIKKL
ncbi:MAG: hypothetical protein ACI9GZ_003901 [Bacteroidia bacterium]|jgi:hypothetical protein